MKPGGASRVVLEQASGLTRRGLDCVIITTKASQEVIKGYPLVKIKQLSKFITGDITFWLLFVGFYRKMKKELGLMENKILYCHSLAIYWGWIYKVFNPGVASVYYIHDLGLPFTDSDAELSSLRLIPRKIAEILRPVFRLINSSVIKSADYIVANSQASANYLFSHYRRKADVLVTPGVNTNTFTTGKSKRDQIISVGRLDKIKNTDVAIKAFAIFTLRNPENKTQLILAGEGKEKESLIGLAKNLSIRDRVTFAGQISLKDIPRYYSQSKLCLAMCPVEAFGLSAAESICSGTPVIGINQNGIKEIVKNNIDGVLADNTVENVAEAIEKCLSKTNFLNKLTRNISQKIRMELDTEIQLKKLYSFFLAIK